MYFLEQKEKVEEMCLNEMSITDIAEKTNLLKDVINLWKKEFELVEKIKKLRNSKKLQEAENSARVLLFKLGPKLRELTPQTSKNSNILISILVRRNKLDEAEKLINEVLNDFPNDSISKSQLVTIKIKQRKLDDAKRLCDELLKQNSDNLIAKSQLVTVKIKEKNFDEAEILCNEILEKKTNDIMVKSKLVGVKIAKKKYNEAEILCNEILEKRPNDIIVKSQLIDVKIATNKLDEAEILCNEILEKRPNDIIAKSQLVGIKIAKKEFNEAEKLCNKILEKKPNNIIAKSQLIGIKIEKKEFNEAEILCNEILKKNSNNIIVKSQLVTVLIRKKQLDKAKKYCNEILNEDSNNIYIINQLAIIEQENGGNFIILEELLKRVISSDDGNIKARFKLIELYEKENKNKYRSEIEKLCNEILERDTKDVCARFKLIDIFKSKYKKDKNFLSEIERLCNEIIELKSNNIKARCILVEIYKENGKDNKIKNVCNEILKYEPDNEIVKSELDIAGDSKFIPNKEAESLAQEFLNTTINDSSKEYEAYVIETFRNDVKNGKINLKNIIEKNQELKCLKPWQINWIMGESYIFLGKKDCAIIELRKALRQNDIPQEVKKSLNQMIEIAKNKKTWIPNILKNTLDILSGQLLELSDYFEQKQNILEKNK